MIADETRAEGLRVLAKHHVAAGLQAGVHYLRDQNPWASEERTPELLKILVRRCTTITCRFCESAAGR